MRRNIKIIGYVAVLLFIAAGIAWQSSLIIQRQRSIVLDQPIRLEEGYSTSHPFTVDVAAKYQIDITCRRKPVPFGTLDQALNKKLMAEYLVSKGTERIAFGDTTKWSSSGYANEYISRTIGIFDASPGLVYTLTLRIKTGLPELASTQPSVRISLEDRRFEEAFLGAALLAYLALGLALIGSLFVVPVALALLCRRTKDDNRNA